MSKYGHYFLLILFSPRGGVVWISKPCYFTVYHIPWKNPYGDIKKAVLRLAWFAFYLIVKQGKRPPQ